MVILLELGRVQFSIENGTKREISTSKIRNSRATKKNCRENGEILSVLGFIPHSNVDSSICCLYLAASKTQIAKAAVTNMEVVREIMILLSPLLSNWK